MASTRQLFQLALLVVTSAALASCSSNSAILDLHDFTHNMEKHFSAMSSARHPREMSQLAWNKSREYVTHELTLMGYDVEEQYFNTTVQFGFEDSEEVMGCNIIAKAMGASTKNTIVVGAHYDSSGERKNYAPLRSDGAGLAVLLEAARAYQDAIRWKNYAANYSTIFVAFDLNTKEQFPESPGHPGSYFFINDWLQPMIREHRHRMAGSIILDSIATYNMDEKSQVVPADFQSVFPSAYSTITNTTNKGDFLAIISPPGESEKLLETFATLYNIDKVSRPYRLQEMLAGSAGFGVAATRGMINHQAAYHFWVANPSLPAVLLTDTDINRQLPSDEICDAIDCDFDFDTDKRMQFLMTTYAVLTRTLLEEQTTYVGDGGGAMTITASLALVMLPAIMARLFVLW